MKNLVKIQFIAIAILLFALWFSCDREKQTEAVTTPEEKGKFEAVKPEQKPIVIYDKKLSKNDNVELERLKKEYNFTQEEINKMITEVSILNNLADNVSYQNDSLRMIIKDYAMARTFNKEFDDENLKLKVSGFVFKNQVERLKIDEYTIKPKKIDIPTKSKTFQLNAGGGVGTDKEATTLNYKLGVDLINSKGNQLELEYQKVNGVEYGMVGYKFKVFAF